MFITMIMIIVIVIGINDIFILLKLGGVRDGLQNLTFVKIAPESLIILTTGG